MQHVSQMLSQIQAAPAMTSTPTSQPSSPSRACPNETACSTCNGIGLVYAGSREERAAPKAIPCPKCGSAVIAAALQGVYPLSDSVLAASLDVIRPVPGEERALAQAKRFAADPAGWYVVQGPPGNAKTLILAGIMNAITARGHAAVFLPAKSIVDLYFRALDPDGSFSLRALERDLRAVDLLVIDEADKVDWSMPYAFNEFFLMLNWRHEHLCWTALAFNDEAKIPDTLLSRMKDGRWGDGTRGESGIIRTTAPDQRPRLKSLWAEASR